MVDTTNIQLDLNETSKLHNLSIEKIASEINVSSMTVRRWIRGEAKPKNRLIIREVKRYLDSFQK